MINIFTKIACAAFDNEMSQLLSNIGVDRIMDNKAIDKTPNMTRISKTRSNSGNIVGITDYYNPTEAGSSGEQLG